jgi:outer membrane protein OmpA-like peptidoglycan-associated protein
MILVTNIRKASSDPARSQDRSRSRRTHGHTARGILALASALLLLLNAFGCATGTGLTRDDVLSQIDKLSRLEANLERTDEEGLDLLAPSGVASARQSLEQAISAARRGDSFEAERLAQAGIDRLEQAAADSSKTAEALRDIIASRQRAIVAGAPELLPDRFEALDEKLRAAARLAEQGNLDGAKDAGTELLSGYSSVELDSLKVDATQLAQKAIDEARAAGAERHASETFGRAKKELDLAKGILETDRNEVARANVNARRASELATRSQFIAEMVREFDRRSYDREAVVLWYQEQLEAIGSPLEGGVSFSMPNHEVVSGLRERIASVVAARRDTDARLNAARERIADLELTSTVSTADIEAREARYDRIQALFSEDEAAVYRQGQDVLLETFGFQFPVGQSEIQSSNFPLLNKIAKAIGEFDSPKVIVTGHTDSTGDDASNQKLSEDRARKVGDFLIQVTEIAPENVTTRGFGESKPVASNETAEGRARNRRIEIAIVNQ